MFSIFKCIKYVIQSRKRIFQIIIYNNIIKLLATGRLQVKDMITSEYSFSDTDFLSGIGNGTGTDFASWGTGWTLGN